MDYFDFELEIGAANANAYPVTVIRSPAGEAHDTLCLPFDEQALSTQLSTLQQALAGSSQLGSPSLASGQQAIQGFGQALFEALFTGQVRDLYVASRTQAESQGKGLRVKLRLQPPELAALPWEFLYDVAQGQYLCLSDKTPLVRYIELPAPCQPLSVAPPLSILGMTASPKDLPELDVAREQQRITTALAPLQSKGLAQITWLTGRTWEDLQQALLAGPWHIFHFIGHGGFDATSHEGVIALEDQAGQSHYLSANQLGTLLADHETLRLVVLNSCKGARSRTRESFSSTAAQVVRHGIPAVLAHQYDISDEAAIALSRTFYEALAAGLPVDTAVGEARKAISLGGGRSLEWATPVLHLHAPDGVLFHLTPPAGPTLTIRQASPSPTGPAPARSTVTSAVQAAPFASQEPLASSLVRIRTTDGRVVGAGFLVGARQILTCAHVVCQALELADGAVELPQAAISLDFPFVPPRTLFTAKVVVWRPPLADGRDDIAGLELQGEPPRGAEVVRFADAADVWKHPFRAFGFPSGYDDGVWATGRLLGRQATDWIMLEDVKAQGFAVAPGFSGAPVWDELLQCVVGMVVAASQPAETKAAFVIPLDVLVATWPLIEPITRQRIFLSAAPADTDFADRLRTDLEARDIVVLTEQHTPDNGQTNKEEGIRQAIRAAQAVVLVVSSQTRSSRTVKEHLRLADLYSRRLILVWTGEEPAQPQRYGWRETIVVDAQTTPYQEALDAIAANLDQQRSISALLGLVHVPSEEEQQEPRNPYKGLRAFTANDAGDFFGRERLVDELVKDVEQLLSPDQAANESGRLLTILGPSGSGKSSVVMAGLLPKLQHGAFPGSEAWVYLEPIVPGKHPIEALTLTLKPHFPDSSFKTLREDLSDDATRGLHLLATQLIKQRGSKVMLLVDQLEELFTQTESEEEREQFIDLLLTAVMERGGPVLVLLTLRADFYHRLMQYPDLYRLTQAHQQPLLPMEVGDLRAVIEQPAALPDVQLTFEGNLVGDLLFEMQGQVGALPLLQFTLEQLFERRSGHRLTLSAYREISGVKGALSEHAEQTYAALPSEEQRKLARSLFVRLIEPGATEQDTTRRRAALSEFTLVDATQTRLMRETIDAFIAARLLTANEVAETTTIEVSHEAVIREWKRLAGWMREALQDIPLQQAISEDVAEWKQRGEPIDRLYRGTQLSEAQEWAERNVPSRDEAAFLQAGIVERQRQEAAEQSRQARELLLKRQTVNRLRYLVVALTLFLVASIVFASVVLQLNIRLRQQDDVDKRIALSRAIAANANEFLSQNELDRGLLLSVKALQTANTYEARNSLLRALEQSPHINTMLHTRLMNHTEVDALTFTSNGTSLVSSSGGEIEVWDTKARTYHTLPLVAQTYGTDLTSVAFSPTGQTMVTAGQAGVWLWDIQTGTQVAHLAGRTTGITGSRSTAFSRDGKVVAFSRCVRYTPDICLALQIVLWNVTSKQRIGTPLVVQQGYSSLALSPDHQVLAYEDADGIVQLWNVTTGQLIGPLANDELTLYEKPVAFSPDGKILAIGSPDTLQLWDVASRQPIGSPLLNEFSVSGLVNDIAFSPDGKTLASSNSDGTVRLWDIASRQPIGSPLISNRERETSVAFSPDGKTLASGSDNGTITLWNIATDSNPISQQYKYTGGVDSAVFSPDGRMIIMGGEDGRIFLQDSKTGERISTLDTAVYPPHQLKLRFGDHNLPSIQSLAISRDGHILAAGRDDGTIILWDMKTRKPFMQFTYTNLLRKIVLSADGQTLAASGDGNTVMLWDVAKRTAIHPHSYQFRAGSLALSPNGRLLAASICPKGILPPDCQAQQIILRDVVTDTPIDHPLVSQGAGDILDLAFSPDGNTLAWSAEAGISLWNVTTRKLIDHMLSVLSENQTFGDHGSIAFSSDGKMLASNTQYVGLGLVSIILWNVTTYEPFTSPIEEGAYIGQLNDMAFSPNGQQLVSVGLAGSVEIGGFGSNGGSIVTLWNMSLASWENQACSIANRNLTREEWRQFVRSEPFDKVCPELPLL